MILIEKFGGVLNDTNSFYPEGRNKKRDLIFPKLGWVKKGPEPLIMD